ncbi:MAG: hypothetical protein FRX49_08216 [Trebouxia sp. A1-2]|nr:MAG: hypothetical protein FRX49_08216 [Trebouxia sp. A1-2]
MSMMRLVVTGLTKPTTEAAALLLPTSTSTSKCPGPLRDTDHDMIVHSVIGSELSCIKQGPALECSATNLAKHKSKGDLTSSESESASFPEKPAAPGQLQYLGSHVPKFAVASCVAGPPPSPSSPVVATVSPSAFTCCTRGSALLLASATRFVRTAASLNRQQQTVVDAAGSTVTNLVDFKCGIGNAYAFQLRLSVLLERITMVVVRSYFSGSLCCPMLKGFTVNRYIKQDGVQGKVRKRNERLLGSHDKGQAEGQAKGQVKRQNKGQTWALIGCHQDQLAGGMAALRCLVLCSSTMKPMVAEGQHGCATLPFGLQGMVGEGSTVAQTSHGLHEAGTHSVCSPMRQDLGLQDLALCIKNLQHLQLTQQGGQIWLDCDLVVACIPIVGLPGDSLDVKLPFMDSLVMRSRGLVGR